MGNNKIVYGDEVLIDLTNDTVNANDVLDGVTFHSADGESNSGTLIPYRYRGIAEDLDNMPSNSEGIWGFDPATKGSKPPCHYPFGRVVVFDSFYHLAFTDLGIYIREYSAGKSSVWNLVSTDDKIINYKHVIDGNIFDLEVPKASIFTGHFNDGIAGGTGIVICYANSYLMISGSYAAVYDKTKSKWKPLLDSSEIEDNLTSTLPYHLLSANQGRVLDEKISKKVDVIGNAQTAAVGINNSEALYIRGYKADGKQIQLVVNPNGVFTFQNYENSAWTNNFSTNIGKVLTSLIINASDVSYTFTDSSIKEDSMIDIYDTIYGFAPKTVTVTNGSCVITFDTQSTSHQIKLKIS